MQPRNVQYKRVTYFGENAVAFPIVSTSSSAAPAPFPCHTPSEANHSGFASPLAADPLPSFPAESLFPVLAASSVPFVWWSWRYQSLGSPPAARARRLASSLRPGRCPLADLVGVDDPLDGSPASWRYHSSPELLGRCRPPPVPFTGVPASS